MPTREERTVPCVSATGSPEPVPVAEGNAVGCGEATLDNAVEQAPTAPARPHTSPGASQKSEMSSLYSSMVLAQDASVGQLSSKRMSSPTRGVRNFAARLRRGSFGQPPCSIAAARCATAIMPAPEVARARERAARARRPRPQQQKHQQVQPQVHVQENALADAGSRVSASAATPGRDGGLAVASTESDTASSLALLAPTAEVGVVGCSGQTSALGAMSLGEAGSIDEEPNSKRSLRFRVVRKMPEAIQQVGCSHGAHASESIEAAETGAAITPLLEKRQKKGEKRIAEVAIADIETPSELRTAASAPEAPPKAASKRPSKAVERLLKLGKRARQQYLSTLTEAQQLRLAMQLSVAENGG